MKRLCWITEPLSIYFKKGEVKPRFYNPGDFFDEVHLITFDNENFNLDPAELQAWAGRAKVFWYKLGKRDFSSFRRAKELTILISKINPNVIEANGSGIYGFLAVKAGKALEIPTVIQLHGDGDRDIRYNLLRNFRFGMLAKALFFKFFIERYVISHADKVVCAYAFPLDYARRYGGKDVQLIYNKVYIEKFANSSKLNFPKPVILFVGRLMKEKGQDCLIKAMKNTDALLLLIGDGAARNKLIKLAEKIGVSDKVIFIYRVPNSKIPIYYKSATIFASAMRFGGASIPIMEAMAAGLPIVMTGNKWMPQPELVGKSAIIVKDDPDEFARAFSFLLQNETIRKKMGKLAQKLVRVVSWQTVEKQEAKMYAEVIANYQKI